MADQQMTLPLWGMTCANCAAKVRRALRNVDGVKDADVNLAAREAIVTFVPGAARLADLNWAVAEAGYEVLWVAEADRSFEKGPQSWQTSK